MEVGQRGLPTLPLNQQSAIALLLVLLLLTCRLQEQLLEAKAREAKACKEREGLEGVVRRLEAQRVATEAELAQIRRMLWEAGERWLRVCLEAV